MRAGLTGIMAAIDLQVSICQAITRRDSSHIAKTGC